MYQVSKDTGIAQSTISRWKTQNSTTSLKTVKVAVYKPSFFGSTSSANICVLPSNVNVFIFVYLLIKYDIP